MDYNTVQYMYQSNTKAPFDHICLQTFLSLTYNNKRTQKKVTNTERIQSNGKTPLKYNENPRNMRAIDISLPFRYHLVI